jgi:hypothetical protein
MINAIHKYGGYGADIRVILSAAKNLSGAAEILRYAQNDDSETYNRPRIRPTGQIRFRKVPVP